MAADTTISGERLVGFEADRYAGRADGGRRSRGDAEVRVWADGVFESFESFSRYAAPRMLRPYQLEAGDAIATVGAAGGTGRSSSS